MLSATSLDPLLYFIHVICKWFTAVELNYFFFSDEDTVEIPYVTILNRVLPSEIRVLAWAPVKPNFSAR